MKFDQYTIVARLFPAVVATVPFFLLHFFFLDALLGPFFRAFFGFQWIGDVSTIFVLLFLLTMIGRSISKDIFERWLFKRDETGMPTTDFLMHSNAEYSVDYKRMLYKKIHSDFGIKLFDAALELQDEGGARKRIAEAFTLIRLRVKAGRLLLQHNIEYGFIRNLVGCSVAAVLVSVLDIWVFSHIAPNTLALKTSIVLLVLYLLPILFVKLLMRVHGRRYARVLIQEYLMLA